MFLLTKKDLLKKLVLIMVVFCYAMDNPSPPKPFHGWTKATMDKQGVMDICLWRSAAFSSLITTMEGKWRLLFQA